MIPGANQPVSGFIKFPGDSGSHGVHPDRPVVNVSLLKKWGKIRLQNTVPVDHCLPTEAGNFAPDQGAGTARLGTAGRMMR